MAYEEFKAV